MAPTFLVVAFVLLSLNVLHADAWGFMKDSLFDADPNIVDLQTTALRHVHANANRCPWFVLIYDAMCGHCRSFAPKLSAFVENRRRALAEAGEGDGPDHVPVLFGAVNCAAAPLTCTHMNITTVPALFAAEPDFALRELAEADHLKRSAKVDTSVRWRAIADRHSIAQEVDSVAQSVSLTPREVATCTGLAEYLRHEKARGIHAEPRSHPDAPRLPRPPVRGFKPEATLYRQDIAGALMVTMWHEVSMAAVSSDGIHALRSFLSAVDEAVPELRAAAILAEMGDGVAASAKVLESHVGWKRLVEAAKIPFQGTNATSVEWRTCRGSTWKERGLPCGLWALYHCLVASAPSGKAVATLKAIRSYVAHFFVCYECRRHFGSLTFSLEDDASDDDAVLWLWRAHNQVNARLVVEKGSSDPAVPKIQWPSIADCRKCRNSAGFDESQVVTYLRRWYQWNAVREPPPETPAPPTPSAAPVTPSAPVVSTGLVEGVGFAALVGLLAYVKLRLVPPEKQKVHTL